MGVCSFVRHDPMASCAADRGQAVLHHLSHTAITLCQRSDDKQTAAYSQLDRQRTMAAQGAAVHERTPLSAIYL